MLIMTTEFLMRTSRTVLKLPFVLLFVVVFAAACSASPSEGAVQTAIAQTELARPVVVESPTPQPSHTPAPTNTPTPTATATATPTASPTATRVPLMASDLQEMMLKLEDLPAGWVERPASPEDDPEEATATFLCKQYERRAILKASADFSQGQLGPFLTHSVVVYPPGTGADQFKIFLAAVEECAEFTSTENGQTSTWTVTKMSFPRQGEESFAIRVTSQFVLGFIEIDSIQFRVEDVLVSLQHMAFGLDGVDTAQTEAFAHEAEKKLNAILHNR